MSCEIKNEKCPFQIQCLFPTNTTDKRPFALYFYTPQGSPEKVLSCAYNGGHRCFDDKGFNATHTGFNNVTITVPDTFTTSKGFFGCQKGDIPMVQNCSYRPPEICNDISTEDGNGLWTTTKGIDFPLTTEQVGNKGIDPTILAGVILGSIVVLAIIIMMSCLLLKKYRPKSYSRFMEFPICIVVSPAIAIEKFQKYVLGKENKGNRVNQTKTNPVSSTLNGGIMKSNCLIRGGNVLTIDPEKANVDQEHASTGNKISSDSSGLQPAPSPLATTCSDGSDKPLLRL